MTHDRFDKLLAQQLEMNPRTWSALEERGIGTNTLLVIEYSFTAPGKRHARDLVKVLRSRTNFSTELVVDGSRLRRHWRVVGHTQPSTASIDMLNEWVTFMVNVGAKHQCRFDGWGAVVPDPQPGGPTGPAAKLQQGFGEHRLNGHGVNGSARGSGGS
ncbi:MAG TPA: ribonuclease E inhibitor RraB [Solirubrobacteraceae bacterium]|jgi:hypothetical protein|nr:ribonuclease E inhibitor RraB [Solirubrobacteraceae bacterium]